MLLNLVALYSIDKQTVLASLEIFWKGMLAIFIVLAIAFLATMLMKQIAEHMQKKKQAAQAVKAEEETESQNVEE